MAKERSRVDNTSSPVKVDMDKSHSVFNDVHSSSLLALCDEKIEILREQLVQDYASLKDKKSIIACLIQHLRSFNGQDNDYQIYTVAVLFDAILPRLKCRQYVCEIPNIESYSLKTFLNDVEEHLSLVQDHFPQAYLLICEDRSETLLHLCNQFSGSSHSFSQGEMELLRGTFKRLPDILAILSILHEDEDLPVMEILGCIVMESCHIIDDWFDIQEKAKAKGFFSYKMIRTTFRDLAEKVVHNFVKEPISAVGIIDDFEKILFWFAKWAKTDSGLGGLSPESAEQRVRECNGDLYLRITTLVNHSNVIRQKTDLIRTYGEITWILDDWRDLEIDRVENHFNVFLNYRYDDRHAYFYYKELVVNRLATIFQTLNGDKGTYAELLTSLGLEDESLWNLERDQ